MKNIFITATLLIASFILNGCFSVKYSLSGASTGDAETCSVQYFPNRAQIVNANLSQQLTDALKDKIRDETSLVLVTGFGDVDFEGSITGYYTQATAIQGNETAAQNRFTITVKVKYSNPLQPDFEFDKNFSRYRDYESTMSFESAQTTYVDEILEEIVEDIFNAAFVNW
jgi:hypothetical protein